MRIGVDFDNTIVCYDDLFHRVATEQGVIPADIPPFKAAIRDYLRQINQEDIWTEMQGYVYGHRMIEEAQAYPRAFDFFAVCRRQGVEVCIISHKTQYPYQGTRYDLHAAARQWLAKHGFDHTIGLTEANIFLELTKAQKLARIQHAACTHFIDDLPEFLEEPSFPSGVHKQLFDPNNLHPHLPATMRHLSWDSLIQSLSSWC